MANENLSVGQSTNKKLLEEQGGNVAEVVSLGGKAITSQVTLATTTSGAYGAGDLIGGQLSFSSVFRTTGVMSGVLQSVSVADKSTMQASLDLVLFGTATTGTTYTNDAAFAVADADLSKIVARVSISNGDYSAFSDNSLADVGGLGRIVKATTGTGLTGAIINRSTGPLYTSTGDLIVTIGVLQD